MGTKGDQVQQESAMDEKVTLKPNKTWGVRHTQAALLFFCLVVAYAMRVNMSVAIVAMTTNSSDNEFPTFEWPRGTQDTILSSFFWGYIVLQVPAGELASRFGGRILLALSLTVNAIVSLIMPMAAAYGGWQAVCACRVVQGLGQGFLFPTMHSLVGKWAPPSERGRLGTYIYAGSQLGTVIELIVAGLLGGSSWGWPSIFYTVGAAGLLWTVMWLWLGADSPASSKHITAEERDYIQSSLGQTGMEKKLSTPWRKILTSLPFWALLIVHCGQNWGFWTLMTEMPTYMSSVLGVNIKSNGVFSALPYFAMYLLSFVFSNVSDYVINKKIVSITAARKISNTIGFWCPALALIGLSYAPAGNVPVAVTLLTVTVALNAGYYVGFQVVHIDMAPNFAGTLMGLTNGVSNMLSIVAPLSVGLLISDDTQASEWRKVFFVASAFYFLTNLFFILFGTSQKQSWNEPLTVADEKNIEAATTEDKKKNDENTINKF